MTRNTIGTLLLSVVFGSSGWAATFITSGAYRSTPNSGPSAGQLHVYSHGYEVGVTVSQENNFGGLARSSDSILIASSRGDAIFRYSLAGEFLDTFTPFTTPLYLGDDAAGNIYVTKGPLGAPTGFRLDATGSPTGQFISPTSTAPVFQGIDADAAGNVYVAETDRLSKPAYLHRYQPNGTIIESTQLNYGPSDIVIDEANQLLFVSQTQGGAPIRVYTLAFGAPVLMAGIPMPADAAIRGLDYSPETNELFAVSFGVDTAVKGFRIDLPEPNPAFPFPFPGPGYSASIVETFLPTDAIVGSDILYIVPEPGSAALVLVTLSMFVCFRRRA